MVPVTGAGMSIPTVNLRSDLCAFVEVVVGLVVVAVSVVVAVEVAVVFAVFALVQGCK